MLEMTIYDPKDQGLKGNRSHEDLFKRSKFTRLSFTVANFSSPGILGLLLLNQCERRALVFLINTDPYLLK